MKFKEMSWEELKIDFEKLLNTFSIEELVDSLEEYVIINDEYSYKIPKNNNLEEKYSFLDVSIENETPSIDMKNDTKKELVIYEYISLEAA